ncbi:MAG: hypothetical protein B7Z69_09215 [Actinobacteria bacterium 21-73-9]|nr:MAG: hypothetical protein B7Z69_09215 [Actinobacteria bacterium 21-73-9]
MPPTDGHAARAGETRPDEAELLAEEPGVAVDRDRPSAAAHASTLATESVTLLAGKQRMHTVATPSRSATPWPSPVPTPLRW